MKFSISWRERARVWLGEATYAVQAEDGCAAKTHMGQCLGIKRGYNRLQGVD